MTEMWDVLRTKYKVNCVAMVPMKLQPTDYHPIYIMYRAIPYFY